VAVTELSWRGLWCAGGVLRQPPKPAQVNRSYRGLPGELWEDLCGDRLVWLCHCHALLYVRDVTTCTCILRAAPFGAELGEILVGSSRGVAICGVVRACTLQGRKHCAGGGGAGRTWRESHTESLRACWPRASDRSRVKQRIHPTTIHFTGYWPSSCWILF